MCADISKYMFHGDSVGTHMLEKYPDILLVVCVIDGNNKMLLVAYTVVEIEKREAHRR